MRLPGGRVKNPIRNEASFVLVVAVIFSAVAIPVLSGFLEPSQPPAVAAVEIGDPRDGASGKDGAPGRQSGDRVVKTKPARTERRRRAPSPKRERRTRPAPTRPAPTQPAPRAPADDLAEDDDGEAD
jgi:hypothetical protein